MTFFIISWDYPFSAFPVLATWDMSLWENKYFISYYSFLTLLKVQKSLVMELKFQSTCSGASMNSYSKRFSNTFTNYSFKIFVQFIVFVSCGRFFLNIFILRLTKSSCRPKILNLVSQVLIHCDLFTDGPHAAHETVFFGPYFFFPLFKIIKPVFKH